MDTAFDIVLLVLILVIVLYGLQYVLSIRVDDRSTKYYKPPCYDDLMRSDSVNSESELLPPSYQEAMNCLKENEKQKTKDELQEIIVVAEVHAPFLNCN